MAARITGATGSAAGAGQDNLRNRHGASAALVRPPREQKLPPPSVSPANFAVSHKKPPVLGPETFACPHPGKYAACKVPEHVSHAPPPCMGPAFFHHPHETSPEQQAFLDARQAQQDRDKRHRIAGKMMAHCFLRTGMNMVWIASLWSLSLVAMVAPFAVESEDSTDVTQRSFHALLSSLVRELPGLLRAVSANGAITMIASVFPISFQGPYRRLFWRWAYVWGGVAPDRWPTPYETILGPDQVPDPGWENAIDEAELFLKNPKLYEPPSVREFKRASSQRRLANARRQ